MLGPSLQWPRGVVHKFSSGQRGWATKFPVAKGGWATAGGVGAGGRRGGRRRCQCVLPAIARGCRGRCDGACVSHSRCTSCRAADAASERALMRRRGGWPPSRSAMEDRRDARDPAPQARDDGIGGFLRRCISPSDEVDATAPRRVARKRQAKRSHKPPRATTSTAMADGVLIVRARRPMWAPPSRIARCARVCASVPMVKCAVFFDTSNPRSTHATSQRSVVP